MYEITYADNTIFFGGEPANSLWNEIEDKPIKKIIYSLGNKNYTLSGFEKYNHVVKYGLLGFGYNGVISIQVMGLYKNKVHQIIFDVLRRKIIKNITDFGKEYNNKYHVGWKQGIISNQLPSIN